MGDRHPLVPVVVTLAAQVVAVERVEPAVCGGVGPAAVPQVPPAGRDKGKVMWEKVEIGK